MRSGLRCLLIGAGVVVGEPKPTETRRIAVDAIQKLKIGQTLTSREVRAMKRYYNTSWAKADFQNLSEEEIEKMKDHFPPGVLPWLDETR